MFSAMDDDDDQSKLRDAALRKIREKRENRNKSTEFRLRQECCNRYASVVLSRLEDITDPETVSLWQQAKSEMEAQRKIEQEEFSGNHSSLNLDLSGLQNELSCPQRTQSQSYSDGLDGASSLFAKYLSPESRKYAEIQNASDSDRTSDSSDRSDGMLWKGLLPFSTYVSSSLTPLYGQSQETKKVESAGTSKHLLLGQDVIDLVDDFGPAGSDDLSTKSLVHPKMGNVEPILAVESAPVVIEIGESASDSDSGSDSNGADKNGGAGILFNKFALKTEKLEMPEKMKQVRKMAVVAPFQISEGIFAQKPDSAEFHHNATSPLQENLSEDAVNRSVPDGHSQHTPQAPCTPVAVGLKRKFMEAGSRILSSEKHVQVVVKRLKISATRVGKEPHLKGIPRIVSSNNRLTVQKKAADKEQEAISLEEELALASSPNRKLKLDPVSKFSPEPPSKELLTMDKKFKAFEMTRGVDVKQRFAGLREFTQKEEKLKASSQEPVLLKKHFNSRKQKSSAVPGHKFRKSGKIQKNVSPATARVATIETVSPLTKLLPRMESKEHNVYGPPIIPGNKRGSAGYLATQPHNFDEPSLNSWSSHVDTEPRVLENGLKKKVHFAEDLVQVREISPRPWGALAPESGDEQFTILDELLPASIDAAPVCCTSEVTVLQRFQLSMLKWHPAWILEYKNASSSGAKLGKTVKMPKILGDDVDPNNLNEIPQKFVSFEEYVEAFFPLFLCEVFEQVSRDYDENASELEFLVHKTNPIKDNLKSFVICALIPKSKNSFEVDNNTLVRIHPSSCNKLWLGYIERWHLESLSTANDCPECLRETLKNRADADGDEMDNLQVLMADLKVHDESFSTSLQLTRLLIQPVCSMLSLMRIVDGLSSLHRSPIGPLIWDPSACVGQFSANNILGDMLFLELYNPNGNSHLSLNPAQKDAVQSYAVDVINNPNESHVGLIHGPPGSGKSQMILGLIEEVKRRRKQFGVEGVILLVAASNGAVDELSRKVIKRNKELAEATFDRMFNFIRIGNPNQIAEDIKEYSLDHLVRVNAARRPAPVFSSEMVQRAQNRIALLANAKKTVLADAGGSGERIAAQISRIDQEMSEAQQVIDEANRLTRLQMPTPKELFEIKKALLIHADVIATTLNSSGSCSLDSLSETGVLCVIVDEACQATELETLIPLRFNSKKLILVGDPFQLPPTVLAKNVAKQRYSASLFQRCMDCMTLDEQQRAVKFLNIQYRMVEPIARFPSQFIYQNRLQTDSNFRSFGNMEESQFVISLCQNVIDNGGTEIRATDIGIITFYKDQVEKLKAALLKMKLRVEVNTVDGFQGREKEVIILSCVRANPKKRHIGFLSDKRRLTVAITRAKSGLYIVANTRTLRKSSEYWCALIDDAYERHLVHQINNNRDFTAAFDTLQEK